MVPVPLAHRVDEEVNEVIPAGWSRWARNNVAPC
jgi:hypothetical protein